MACVTLSLVSLIPVYAEFANWQKNAEVPDLNPRKSFKSGHTTQYILYFFDNPYNVILIEGSLAFNLDPC